MSYSFLILANVIIIAGIAVVFHELPNLNEQWMYILWDVYQDEHDTVIYDLIF